MDEAIRDYVEAGRVAPEPARTQLLLKAVGLLEKQGRGRDALAALEEAVGAGAQSAGLFSALGDLRVRRGRRRAARPDQPP